MRRLFGLDHNHQVHVVMKSTQPRSVEFDLYGSFQAGLIVFRQ